MPDITAFNHAIPKISLATLHASYKKKIILINLTNTKFQISPI